MPDVDVSIKPHESYYYIQDQDYSINIQASYRHGNLVNGDAFVLFGVKRGNERKHLPDSLRKIKIYDGEGTVDLEKKDLLKVFRNEHELTEWTLYVSVTVIPDSGAGIVKAEMEGIPIVKTLHKIIFAKTPAYFKPGLPYDFMVQVLNPNGSPAHGVLVVAQPGQVRGISQDDGTVRLSLNTGTNTNALQITVQSEVPKFSNDQQASASMTATAYKPVSGNYLHLSVTGVTDLGVGKNVGINFVIRNSNPAVQNQINHFTYLVLSRGRIIQTGRQERTVGQTLVTLNIPVTWELLPSFRFVAYYVIKTGSSQEIVSDSVWIDVKDSCMSTLEITDYGRNAKAPSPGLPTKLKIIADYKAQVGLLSVGKEVNEQNAKFRLSQKKVWDIVGKSDSGCTAGGGADGSQVFYDAGLALQSNFGLETALRSEYLCEGTQRRVRRSTSNGDYKPSKEVWPRSEFPESWMWKTEIIQEKPDRNGISTKVVTQFLKDTIVTWEILAVSLVEGKGICVAPPYEIKVMKSFFIDLKLPYSLEVNEQVEIHAILYNNKQNQIKVRVEWTYNPGLCTASNSKHPYHQEVTIQPLSSVRVPFVLVPLSIGKHYIEVKAMGKDDSDGIRKNIQVVPKGHLVNTIKTIILQPTEKGRDGVQVEKLALVDFAVINQKISINTMFIAQGTPLTDTVKPPIDGVNLLHLIKEVKGNGESNMMALTGPVIATYYLDATDQWSKVQGKLPGNLRDKAINYIKSGFANQLTFRKSDSSYGQTLTTPGSTWLTAYIVKIFHLTSSLFKVETSPICNSIKWLLYDIQKADGSFHEPAPVSNREMMGGNKRTSNELTSSLTSFVLVAILKSRSVCEMHINSISFAITKANEFLKKVYPSLRDPYSIAITSYALSLAGELQDTNTLMAAATGNYWNEPSSHFISIEATSYGLLTLIQMNQLNYIDGTAKWLAEQRFYGDTDGQTQATVMMFQALAEYYNHYVALTNQDLDLEFLLGFPMGDVEKFALKSYDSVRTYSRQVLGKEDCTITARGKGRVTLTVMQSYYYSSDVKKNCDSYDLSVKAHEEYLADKPKNVISTVAMTICVRSLKLNYLSVAVVEVVMLSGFLPDINDLNKLKERKDMSIDFNKESCSKGLLILYLSKVSHTWKQCLVFNTHQYSEADHLQPASVTIYDYHTPDNRCSKFYHMVENINDLGMICIEDNCRCTEGNCYIEQQKDDNNPDFLYNKICEESVTYAYKATLSDIKNNGDYSTYVMTIQIVLKEGEDVLNTGSKRNFLYQRKCQHSLNLEKGRDYFIWGKREDFWNLPSGFFYIIGRDTWFEWYPNQRDCQNPENSYLCEKAQQLEEDMIFKACMI
ncbi:A.superbus venom factor 1-like isoform X2 [Pyxicephalus adspersus]|uniref:A.superbus venom factor 1-like isoform X2 n=1 Tax=Pyxicephalus adspersus TaxID=30357 RepID=UPI003B59CA45